MLTLAWTMTFTSISYAQVKESKFGAQLTPRGTVRVLIVFAEVVGTCGTAGPSNWTAGQLPDNADLYLDHVISSNLTTKASQYYKDISLGELDVIGDYYGEVVQLPCSMVNSASGDVRDIIDLLDDPVDGWQPASDGNFYTANGINLDDFDMYNHYNSGIEKQLGQDGNIDVTIVLWRNYDGFLGCGSGYGVGNVMYKDLKHKKVRVYGSWGLCPAKLLNPGYDDMFIIEFFHALYGGNNFHTGGGEDSGAFMFTAASHSTSAQSGSSSHIVNGWDRQFLDWRGGRQHRISASNLSGQEVVSDISVATHPNTTQFILNDFVTVGDAIRIKLPHFDWQANGDKKNQYLWLENHQQENEFDVTKNYSTCGDWVPGLHAYVQVGKELITGDIYGGSFPEPNDLNDWFFPLPAEGRHDYFYSDSDKNRSWENCQWAGNYSMPYSILFPDGSALPNPLTGYSDAFGKINSNNDGTINQLDTWQPKYQKWYGVPVVGSPPSPTIPNWGDHLDPFTHTGQKMTISTNPAPMPVYTQREGASGPSNYDNRSIHLNNISVKILDSDYYNVGNSGPKSMHIEVRFNEKFIENDVRWCGNVVLKNDPLDPHNRAMEINVKPYKCLLLDKGLSPTKLNEVTPGSKDFTDDSYLHILDGTKLTLQYYSKLKVSNGSTLHVQSGGTLIIGFGAKIEVDATSTICIEEGATVIFQSPTTSKIIVDGTPYFWNANLQNITLSSASTNYFALNDITTGGTSPGVSMPSSGNVLLEAGNSIVMGPKTVITPNSGQLFLARIDDPYDCSNVDNYDELLPPDVPGSAADAHNHDHGATNLAGELEEAEELVERDPISIFPNPSDDLVYIQFEEAIGHPVSLEIYDMQGRFVKRKMFATDQSNMRIDVTEFVAGSYLLAIKREGDTFFKKLVIYH